MKTYKIRGTALLYKGRVPYNWKETVELVHRALGKKRAWPFLRRLSRGEASTCRQVIAHEQSGNDNWSQLHGRRVNGEYHFFCSGPQIVALVRRINGLKEHWNYDLQLRFKMRSAKRKWKKRKKKTKRVQQTPKKKKQPPCPPASLDLTRQFQHTTLSWDQAVDMATAVFGVARDSKNTARQIVARRLYNSLDKCGWQRAQYKQHGFTLQFNLQGPWMVNTGASRVATRVTVWCTKDNHNPVYRRMRKWLRKQLLGHPQPQLKLAA